MILKTSQVIIKTSYTGPIQQTTQTDSLNLIKPPLHGDNNMRALR